ncbi:MAG: phytoene desaturase family protein [bacterium]
MIKKKVVVIGAGLGGISAAASLASKGYDVEIFEKNSHVGGKLNLLKKDGFSFDLGPSILTLPHLFQKLFDEAGKKMEDYVSIQPLRPHWRNFFEDGIVIDLTPDMKEMKLSNPTLSNQDIVELEKYLEYSKGLYDFAERGYFKAGLDTLWEVITFYNPFSLLKSVNIFSTLHEKTHKYISNSYLQTIMDFFIKYVGSSAYNAPAILGLLAHVQFKYDLWYVDGGLYNLAKGLEKLLLDIDVKIHLNSEIVKLEKNGGKIIRALLASGEYVEADIFISDMEIIPAYLKLTNEPADFIATYEKKFEPACSGLVLYLGVDREYPQLAHHNFFFSQNPKEHFRSVFDKKILPDDPTIYLVAPARTDKSQAPAGCENIKILPHIPYLQDKPFTAKDYSDLRDRVLIKLEKMGLTDLRKHIITEDMWTPEDIEKNYYSNRGAIYGVVSDKKKNLGFKAPKESTLYKNLYFVGGSVNPGGGMPMAVLSGQQVCDKIIKKYGEQK